MSYDIISPNTETYQISTNDTMNRSALILLVEDDQSMLDGMHDLLQMPDMLQTAGISYNIQIKTANNGEEALGIMASHTPDLIVSDIMMPVMDGYQFLKTVQANPEWLHIPFIFLTAKGHRKEILEGKLQGVNLYITKPFASTELLELIKSQLDISFQRQLTQQQNVADLKKGILQVLNHEFRTPLTYVTAYYEMLAESLTKFPDHQNFQEYLRGIQAGCIRLTKLIDDFIFVIELRTGEFQAVFQQRSKPITNINSLVQSAIHNLENQAKQKSIDIHFEPSADLPAIVGDEKSLLNAFGRLLSNAIKFTPEDPNSKKNIYISTYVQDDDLNIVFQDEGMGFPANIGNQIFDLFFQYNRELLEQQGAGVGLTIAKGLVDLHEGNISVESQEGVGSKFTVTLPIYTDGQTKSLDVNSHSHEPKQATVLLVEDEENLLLGLKELLEIFGGDYRLDVLTASNGQHGLEVLRKQKPDLIISDIMMPVMNGYTFLQRVRQNPDWIQIPFVFLTAKGERKDVHRGLTSGAEIYITKPYDSDELLQLVTAQLDHHFQLQDVMVQNFDDLKRSILHLITPDFRLPLTDVQVYSETMIASLSEVQNDSELKDSLAGIRDGSVKLARLVEDFISLAELKTGEAEIAFGLREQPIYNPGLLLCEASRACKPLAASLDIWLFCDFTPDLPPIFGDSKTLLDGIRRFLETIIKLCEGVQSGNIIVSVTQKSADIELNLNLPPSMSAAELERVAAILSDNEEFLSEMPDVVPSLSIAKSYIDLNNGRIEANFGAADDHHIYIYFPIYTPGVEDSNQQ